MDEGQLEKFILAVVTGHHFELFPTIAFLPDIVSRGDGKDHAKRLGYMHASAVKPDSFTPDYHAADFPKPFSEYLDAEFRTRLLTILNRLLQDLRDKKNIIDRYPHLTTMRRKTKRFAELDQMLSSEIAQFCLDLMYYILQYEGDNNLEDRSNAAAQAVFTNHGGTLPVTDFFAEYEEPELTVNPEHLPTLRLIAEFLLGTEMEKLTIPHTVLDAIASIASEDSEE